MSVYEKILRSYVSPHSILGITDSTSQIKIDPILNIYNFYLYYKYHLLITLVSVISSVSSVTYH